MIVGLRSWQAKLQKRFPSLIFITGTDGAGKSCIAQWLLKRMEQEGLRSRLVWSRFNNFLSKPFLGLTRLSSHNYSKTIDNVTFGFHDFESLGGLRHLFVLLQAIDVNIATFWHIQRIRQNFDLVICERGPWDTLVDVISDTNLDLSDFFLYRLFITQVHNDSLVLFIKRSKENILKTRPELIHDVKLDRRMTIYEKLARTYGWFLVNNNGMLDETKRHISHILKL